MSKLKSNKRKRQVKRSNLNNAVLIDFSHRLCLSSGEFDPQGASVLINNCVSRTNSVLELFKTQFTVKEITALSNVDLCNVLFSVAMEIGDISSLMTAFEKSEQQGLDAIWQNLDSVKKVIISLCTNLAEKGVTYESNENICISISSVKKYLLNIEGLFTEICNSKKHSV